MSRAVSRRTALRGSVAASLGLAALPARALEGKSPASADAVLIAQAEHFRALCARERQAWGDVPDDDPSNYEWKSPAVAACNVLFDACLDAGEALAEMPARTPVGLAAKASVMLALLGPRLDSQAALSEHHLLVASILRDAVLLGGGAHA